MKLGSNAYRRLFSTFYHERGYLTLGLIALIGGSGINLIFPFLFREVLNESDTLGLSLKHDLGLITIIIVSLLLVQAVFFFLRHYSFSAAGLRVVTRLRARLFECILAQEVGFFDSSRVGDLLSRLSGDVQLVQKAVSANISVILRYGLQVTGGVAMMLYLSPKLSLVIFALIPAVGVSSIVFGRRLRILSKKMQGELAEANVIAEETVSSIRTVLVYSGANREVERFSNANATALNTGIRRTLIAAIFSSSMVLLMNSALAFLLWLGGRLLLEDALTLGDLTAFLLYGTMVAVSVGFLSGAWDELTQAVGACDRVFEIIERSPLLVEAQNAKTLPHDAERSIEFKKVTFSYPLRPEKLVLRNVSFRIDAGQTVALVGPSGGGKSTIASLIPKFYTPSSGSIIYSGIDLQDVDTYQLRHEISMVTQTPEVFSLSIGENVAYGLQCASEEDIWAALEAANLKDFVLGLPQGLSTPIGDKGVLLSGGQKQRITIARALLHNPRVLILDEATSSLDSENERLVQEAIENLISNRTTLIIAHRLSTVQNADTVLVIQDGHIAESGTHRSLLGGNGIYANLVQHQLL